MSHKMFIFSVLVSIFVLYKSENTHAAGENEKQLADVLAGILSNPGWQEINHVQVKHTENLVLSEKNLPNDPRVNEENSGKMAKEVGDLDCMENVGSKYLTTVHLLGCVYANVLFEFCHSFANILLMNKKERNISRSKAQNSTRKEHCNAENLIDNDFDRRIVEGQSVEGSSAEMQSMADEEPQKKRLKKKSSPNYTSYKEKINYGVSSEIISIAMRVLQNSYQMFDCMQGVLRYLHEVIPERVGIDFGFNFADIVHIKYTANLFFRLSMDLLNTVPENIDENINEFTRRASNLLTRAINGSLKNNIVPYLEKNCIIVPDTIVDHDFTTLMNTSGGCHLSEPQSNIAQDSEKQIETLVQVFKSSYFSRLGLMYDETEHKIIHQSM